jgi:Transcriptional regulator, AbiEi antitoxin
MPEPPEIRPGNRTQSRVVRALAADQDGIVARAQLLERAISRSAITRALRSGTLHRLHRGVYSTVSPELLGEDAFLLSALFAAGPEAFLSHGTAAWRWQIVPAPPRKIEPTATRGPPQPPRAAQHGTKQIDDRPDAVVADLSAFAEAITLGYAARECRR